MVNLQKNHEKMKSHFFQKETYKNKKPKWSEKVLSSGHTLHCMSDCELHSVTTRQSGLRSGFARIS